MKITKKAISTQSTLVGLIIVFILIFLGYSILKPMFEMLPGK